MSVYSLGFKQLVVSRVLSSNESVSRVAMEFQVSRYSVYQWVKQYRDVCITSTLNGMDQENDSGHDGDDGDLQQRYELLVKKNRELSMQLNNAHEQVGSLREEVNFLKKVSRHFAIDKGVSP